MHLITDDCVFFGDAIDSSASAAASREPDPDGLVIKISARMASVSFSSPAGEQQQKHQDGEHLFSSPLTRSQLRRQSDSFQFARPSERRK
jgi:hypothetical protein